MDAYSEMQALYEQGQIVATRTGIFGATAFETSDGLVKAEMKTGATYCGVVDKFWRVTLNGAEVMYMPNGLVGTTKVFEYFIAYLKMKVCPKCGTNRIEANATQCSACADWELRQLI